MSRTVLAALAICLLLPGLAGQTVDDLATRASDYIRDFFKNHSSVTVAVTGLENHSSLPTAALERTYQLIYSRLTEFNNNRFLDLLIDFSGDQPRFNLTKPYQLTYLIQLRFIQNRTRVGIGITIFSRRLDRIVGIKYVEAQIPDPEKLLLATKEFSFKEQGFAREAELETRTDLMDIIAAEIDGVPLNFFLFPGEIAIYKTQEHGLEKAAEIKLKWPPPYYPTLHPEGKLGIFPQGQSWILTVGANFSAQSKIFRLQEGSVWQEAGTVPFVPLGLVSLNQKKYLVGSPYETGKNWFQSHLMFMTVLESGWDKQSLYERQVPPFFALAFSATPQSLELTCLVDTSYQFSCYPADFSTPIQQVAQKGGALAILDNRWLAISDYTSGSDRLFFWKIEGGVIRPTYENPEGGEILFIAAGFWRNRKGFWVCLQKGIADSSRRGLEFWSKGDE